jgi:hypothetical protein
MATFKGNLGTMSIGATVATAPVIGELRSFELETSSASTSATRMGQVWEVNVPTISAWQGSCEVFWDVADVGQVTLVVGTVVRMNMFPQGNGAPATDVYYFGDAIVEKVTNKQTHDGLVERSVSFKGTGALTQGTV